MNAIYKAISLKVPVTALFLTLALTTSLSSQVSATVSGTVLDSRGQTPISGIQVSIDGGGQSTTNASGEFRISNVSPGTHVIQAIRSGWSTLLPNGSSARLTVRPGETIQNLRLHHAPFGVVSGQIRNSDGMPAAGAMVQALVASYQEGRRVLVAPAQAIGVINSSTETDENGEYHLDLPPGVYYMTGQYRESKIAEPSAARALAAPFRVYYPGTSDVALAATIKLNGGEVPGIDFMLPVTPADLHKIYIHLEGNALALNSNMSGVQIGELRDRITSERIPIVGSFVRGNSRSSEFVIDGVPDGSFDLFVDGIAGGVRGRGVVPVDIRGKDIHDVRIDLETPQDITGRISYVDGSRPRSLSGVTVQLGSGRASVAAGGEFTVPKVPRGYQAVRVDGLPPEAYVADVRYGGTSLHATARSITGPELEAGPGGTPLEIVVATNGGSIEGIVESRQAAAGATIVLVPPTSRQFIPSYYKIATAGPDGEFSIKGAAPGVYQIFAWDSVPDTAWLNPQFMSRWEGRGQTVSVEAGASSHVRPRLLRQED